MDHKPLFGGLAGEPRHDKHATGSARVVPLTVENVSALRLVRCSRFEASALREHIAQHGEFCFQVNGTNEYIVGGQWRRRADIGYVLEMTQGKNRSLLLGHLLTCFKAAGMRVVVVTCDDTSLYVSLYAKHGFEKLDEIIELERFSGAVLPPEGDVRIRGYTPEDSDDVMRVDSESFPCLWQNSYEELRWYSSVPGVEIYVAEDSDGVIVGYAGITDYGINGHLDRLAVRPDWQRQGYGTALLSFSIRRLERRRPKRIALSTESHNVKSQNLYRKFGFRHTFRSHTVYGLRLD